MTEYMILKFITIESVQTVLYYVVLRSCIRANFASPQLTAPKTELAGIMSV